MNIDFSPGWGCDIRATVLVFAVGILTGIIGTLWLKSGPEPTVSYIERNSGWDGGNMFADPEKFTPPLHHIFIVKTDTLREIRQIELPTNFAQNLQISEPEPLRFRRGYAYYRYYDTADEQLRIEKYALPEKRFRAGTNIDFLRPWALAVNPYLTYRGIGPTAWALVSEKEAHYYAGIRLNIEF